MSYHEIFDGVPDELRGLLRPGPLPRWVPPMLATLTDDRFSDPDWLFERKLDGVRCLAFRDRRGRVRLMSRNEHDMTATYPEVADALAGQTYDLVLDGEIVAFRGRRTSFERLQGRSGLTDPAAARASGIPVFYYVFDAVHVDGHDIRALPLRFRKQLLRKAVQFTDPLRYSTHRVRDGEQAYRAACQRGDEGVVAKRAGAPYAAGRSKDWLKFKCLHEQELIIGGYTEPKGSRSGFGALLVGYRDGDRLVYAGKVGTGFGQRMLTALSARLSALEQNASPFEAGAVRERGAHWVRPVMVAQIGFAEWTRDGLLRQPRFLGLRTDKAASEVVRERPQPSARQR